MKKGIVFLLILALCFQMYGVSGTGNASVEQSIPQQNEVVNVIKDVSNECYIGNNSGNILNGGFVAEGIGQDDYFYSDIAGSGSLMYYADGSNYMVTEDRAYYLNVVGNTVYYVTIEDNKACIKSIGIDGNNQKCLVSLDVMAGIMDLYAKEDYLCYKSDGIIYKYDLIQGISIPVILQENYVNDFIPVSDGYIYTARTENGNTLNYYTESSQTSVKLADNVSQFDCDGEDLYFTKQAEEGIYYISTTGENYHVVVSDCANNLIAENGKLYYYSEVSQGEAFIYDTDMKTKESCVIDCYSAISLLRGSVHSVCENMIMTPGMASGGSTTSVISEATGTVSTGEYESWKQSDSRWGSFPMGTEGKTMSQIGCALTSVAILAVHKNWVSESTFNPGTLCTYMNNNGGLTAGGAIYWTKVTSFIPGYKYTLDIALSGTMAEKAATIATYVNQGYAVVVRAVLSPIRQHWVAAQMVSGDTVLIMDPGSNSNTTLLEYDNQYLTRIVCYSGNGNANVTTPYLKIKGYNYPSAVSAGSSFSLKGVIYSNSSITWVGAGVYNRQGVVMNGSYATATPNSTMYDIRGIDDNVRFGILPAGNYTYVVEAKTSSGAYYKVVNVNFTVGATSFSDFGVSVVDQSYAPNVYFSWSVDNAVSYDIKITNKDTGAVTYSKENFTANSYSLSLSPGNYTVQVFANNSNFAVSKKGSTIVNFTLKDIEKSSVDRFVIDYTNGFLKGATENTTALSLVENSFNNVLQRTVVIRDLAGNSVEITNTNRIGTGYIVEIMNGASIDESFIIIVQGDNDGDGVITSTDYLRALHNYIGDEISTKIFNAATDMDGNGIVNNVDYATIRTEILS